MILLITSVVTCDSFSAPTVALKKESPITCNDSSYREWLRQRVGSSRYAIIALKYRDEFGVFYVVTFLDKPVYKLFVSQGKRSVPEAIDTLCNILFENRAVDTIVGGNRGFNAMVTEEEFNERLLDSVGTAKLIRDLIGRNLAIPPDEKDYAMVVLLSTFLRIPLISYDGDTFRPEYSCDYYAALARYSLLLQELRSR